MSEDRPILAIPLGDPAGIGPELCVRLAGALPERARIAFVGDPAVWAAEVNRIRGPMLPIVEDVPAAVDEAAVLLAHHPIGALPVYGAVDSAAGAASHAWVARSVELALAGEVAGVVTPPIHKEAWHLAGVTHAGHTEALREWAQVDRALMFFVGAGLRVALASVHVPLRQVPDALTTPGLVRDLTLLHAEAQRWFGLTDPRIAVCGVNPHAGEGGLLGQEDEAVIAPAVAAARAEGLSVEGPLPADACIPRRACGRLRPRPGHVSRPGAAGDQGTGSPAVRKRHAGAAVHPHLGGPRHGVRHRRKGHRRRHLAAHGGGSGMRHGGRGRPRRILRLFASDWARCWLNEARPPSDLP